MNEFIMFLITLTIIVSNLICFKIGTKYGKTIYIDKDGQIKDISFDYDKTKYKDEPAENEEMQIYLKMQEDKKKKHSLSETYGGIDEDAKI